eukprot:773053_1
MEKECCCANEKCCKALGLMINICTILVGLLSILAGTTLWSGGMDVDLAMTHLFMIGSGLFIIITESFYLPRLMMYVKCHQTLWGRTIYFFVLALLSYMNGDALHITCMALILFITLFFIIYGLVSIFWLKIPYGVPPPLYGFPTNEQDAKLQSAEP